MHLLWCLQKKYWQRRECLILWLQVWRWKKYLVNSLDKNGYRHKGEAGNFIFIEPKTDAQTIVDRMKAEKKILIKAYPNVGDFGNCLRVSIGEEKYMKQFMEALLEIDQ